MTQELKQTARVMVVGTGNFGTCLAQHLAEQGHEVSMVCRTADTANQINTNRKNPKYLNTITLSDRISATHKVSTESLAAHETLLLAVPTQAMREVMQQLPKTIPDDVLIICAAKGIEMGTLQLPMGIIKEVLGKKHADRAVFLSGPSFAIEIVHRQPTAVVVGSRNEARAIQAQNLFHAPHFRTYTSDDPIGLEIAGALKNVIAIAAGACVGMGFQANSRAALLTRGLAEIVRVGAALGANPLTFNGLGGVGDLFLTCSSEKSRNYTVGYRLGKGESLADVLATVGSVAEGVATTQAAYQMAQNLKVSAPITDQLYKVLYENKPIAKAVRDLLEREAKSEIT